MIKQLAKELKNLDESPPEGIKVGINDDDFSTIFADIEGPGMWLCLKSSIFKYSLECSNVKILGLAAGTPYDNGVFRMKLLLSRDFPHSPPKGMDMLEKSKIFSWDMSRMVLSSTMVLSVSLVSSTLLMFCSMALLS